MNAVVSIVKHVTQIRRNGSVLIQCGKRKLRSCTNPYTVASTEIGCASLFSVDSEDILSSCTAVRDGRRLLKVGNILVVPSD